MRVAAGAAVAEAEVQVAVRAERELPAVVVRVRLVEGEEDALGGRVEQRRQRLVGDAELGEHGVAVALARRVVDEGARVVRPVGMQRQPEQALLAAAEDAVA